MAAGGASDCGALALRIFAAAAFGVLVSACTTGSVPPLDLALQSLDEGQSSADDNALSSGQKISPEEVTIAASDEPAPSEPVKQETAKAPDEANPTVVAEAVETTDENAAVEPSTPEATGTVVADDTTKEPSAQAEIVAAAKPEPEKKRGFLSSLWTPKPRVEIPAAKQTKGRLVLASATPAPAKKKVVRISSRSSGGEALPGVRDENKLFEISRKSGLNDDSDIDLNENEATYKVASASGLARLAPNGLLTQREGVDVACIKPALVRVLKKVERHYGKRVVVTSGYRSPAYNRRARGARNSLHMYCAAVDVQVEGVTKWELAKYLRSMPGRGGVGTYCHTKSVHVDVGPERDWNWRCRRRKKRRS